MTRERSNRDAARRRWAAVIALSVLISACSGETSSSNSTESTDATTAVPNVLPVLSRDAYEWRQLPIGAGGFVTGIVAGTGPQATLYARTDVGGAYRFDRSAATWTQLVTATSVPDPNVDGTDLTVDSIAVAPSDDQRVYAAIGSDYNPGADGAISRTGRVLVSDDGGTTWRTSAQRWFVSGNQRYRVGSERLTVDPNDRDHVLFGTSRDGLWQSTDGGASWQQVPTSAVPTGQFDDPSADQVGVGTVAFVGPHMVAGVASVGVFVSDDRGTSWTLVHGVAPEMYPAGAVDVGGTLWLSVDHSGEGNGFVATYEFGSGEWRELQMPTGSPFFSVAVDPRDSSHVALADYAVRDGHFWTSSDGGTTWDTHDVTISSPTIPWLARTDLADFMSTGRLLFDPADGSLWFAEGMSVWHTTDPDRDDVVWTSTADGIEETVTTQLVVPPGGVPIGAVADRQGFRWTDITRPPSRTLIDKTFVGGTSVDYSGGTPSVIAWVGAEYQIYYDKSRRARGAISTDGGATWKQFKGLDREMFGGEVAVSATDSNVLVWLPTHFANTSEYLTEPAGVWSTTNGGSKWHHTETVGGTDAFHRLLWWFGRRALAADRVNGNFYLQSDDGQFFVSSDAARTWTPAVHAAPCTEQNACHVFGQVQAQPGTASRVWASTGNDGLYRTDDAGATEWQRLPGIDVARAFGFGAPLTPGGPVTVFVYGTATGDNTLALLRSSDDGATWERISQYPAGLSAAVTSVTGDPNVPGRVYVGFSGTGYVRGDIPGSG